MSLIDPATIQRLLDREQARQRATPILSCAALDQAIAAAAPSQPDPADDTRAAFTAGVATGRAVGERQGYAQGTKEGIAAGVASANAVSKIIRGRL